MPTTLYTGVMVNKDPVLNTEDNYAPAVVITDHVIQVFNEQEELVVEFSYEELRGIMGVMAAEQEKEHFIIRAKIKEN
jgi:hypothetical protein